MKIPVQTQNPDQKEIQSFMTHHLWKRIIEKNQEFDQFVIDKLSSVFMHFEVKSVERQRDKYLDRGLRAEYNKACEQIKLGKEMFRDIIAPVCDLSNKWSYQGFLVFPNVSDRTHFSSWNLSAGDLKKIVTKEELQAG